MEIRTRSLLEIHIAVLLFGLTGLFGKFLNLPAPFIVLGRVFFATVALGIVFIIKRVNIRLRSKKDYCVIFMLGALLAFHWSAFYQSVKVSTVAIALLTFSAYPIFVTFFEPIMFHEKLKKLDIVFAFIMFLGKSFGISTAMSTPDSAFLRENIAATSSINASRLNSLS